MKRTVLRAREFRELLARGLVVMPGAPAPIIARMAEHAGFKAIYVSGAGLSNINGMPDEGLLTRAQVVKLSLPIISAVSVPVIVDVDTGFGGPIQTALTVRVFEHLGVAGVQIEDQVPEFKRCGHLGGKQIIPPNEMIRKIRAAVAAKRSKDFLVIARTDATAVEGFDAAIVRARAYAAAGADIIFPEALESREEFVAVRKALPTVSLLANMTEYGKTPYLSAADFAAMGYNIVIFPQTAFRAMLQAAAHALETIKRQGTQKELVEGGCLMSRARVNDFLG